jgi:SAM-dependent methyltransferase
MLDAAQYRLLRRLSPSDPPSMMCPRAYEEQSKLQVLLGDLLGDVHGKTVIDFGCGDGLEALELVRNGAGRVIGLEVNLGCIEIARWYAAQAHITEERLEFAFETKATAHVVISIDSFEHFGDPAGTLQIIHDLLRPNGVLVASFGPPWFHPLGGHLFSLFPWAHLLFSEAALIRWRNDLREDRPTTFAEAGLNRMTVRRFERLVAASEFDVECLDVVPIRRVARFHNRLTREFFTSVVRSRLRKRGPRQV